VLFAINLLDFQAKRCCWEIEIIIALSNREEPSLLKDKVNKYFIKI
jgi:hypothetical protein